MHFTENVLHPMLKLSHEGFLPELVLTLFGDVADGEDNEIGVIQSATI